MPLSKIFQLYRGGQFYWCQMVEETGGPGENYWSIVSHGQTLLHNIARVGFKLTLVVIGTDCIGSCKSNYHTITTMMAPFIISSEPVPTFILHTCNSKSKIS
jgi:hypothetical protein